VSGADRVLAPDGGSHRPGLGKGLSRALLDAIFKEPAFSLVASESASFLEVLACDLGVTGTQLQLARTETDYCFARRDSHHGRNLAFLTGDSISRGFCSVADSWNGGAFFASAGSGSWVSRLLSLKPLVYIGKISYSMYLVHWPIKVFAGYFVRDYTLGWRWAPLVVALGLAMAQYHLVENPVRRSAYFDRPRHFLVAYAAGFTVVVLLAVSALASKGWRHRFSADVLRLADATDDRDEQASKAFSFFLEQRKEGGVLVFSHGCMPVLVCLGVAA